MNEPPQDPNTISTDLISAQRKLNEDALKRKGLSAVEKLVLQNQDVILMFISKDHSKTIQMWNDYLVRKTSSRLWEPRIWQIIKEVAMWGIIAALTYLFINKP